MEVILGGRLLRCSKTAQKIATYCQIIQLADLREHRRCRGGYLIRYFFVKLLNKNMVGAYKGKGA